MTNIILWLKILRKRINSKKKQRKGGFIMIHLQYLEKIFINNIKITIIGKIKVETRDRNQYWIIHI